MFGKKMIRLLVFMLFLVLLVSCAKAPSDSVKKTQTAIEEAKSIESDVYFPLKFMAIRDSVNLALAEIEQQKKRFFLNRNYGRAERLLLVAHSELEAMIKKTDLKKEETKLKAQQVLVDINLQIEAAKNNIPVARKNKLYRDIVNRCESDVVAIESEMPLLRQLIQDGQHLTALNKATSNSEKIKEINADLREIMIRANAKRASGAR